MKRFKRKYLFPKLKTGIPGFDDLFVEGIPKGSSILVEGGPGSGKTILCLQLAHNFCKQGKKVLYMSFEEQEKDLKEHMEDFKWKPDFWEKKGLFMIKRFSAIDVSRSVEALLSEAKKELLIEIRPVLFPKGFDPDIIVIDSLSSIASAFTGEESRFRIYMEQLFRYLERTSITSFLIRETALPTHAGYTYVEKGEAVSFLSDGIITLYNVFYESKGTRERALEILKMRGEDFKRKIVKMKIINGHGIVVYPNKIPKGQYKLT